MAQNDYELLSALKDGELDEAQTARLLERLESDPEMRRRWQSYHLVADAVRNNVPTVLKHDLASRVSAALVNEPTVLSPTIRSSQPSIKLKHDKTLTGYAVAASVAVIGFLTVGLVSNQFDQETAPGMASVATVSTSGLVAPVSTHTVEAPVVATTVAENTDAASAAVTLQAEEPNLQPYLLRHELSAPALARSPLAPQVRVVTYSSDMPAQ